MRVSQPTAASPATHLAAAALPPTSVPWQGLRDHFVALAASLIEAAAAAVVVAGDEDGQQAPRQQQQQQPQAATGRKRQAGAQGEAQGGASALVSAAGEDSYFISLTWMRCVAGGRGVWERGAGGTCARNLRSQ